MVSGHLLAEIVETTLVVSRFRFLRVGSWISVLRATILQGAQILKVGYPTEVGFVSRFSHFMLLLVILN